MSFSTGSEYFKGVIFLGNARAVLAAILVFVLGLVMLFIPDKAKNYHDNGIEVRVKITEKYGARTKQYQGVYLDENGGEVYAKVIPNCAGVFVGDILTGYYMPDKPDTVICYTGSGMMIIVRLLGFIFSGSVLFIGLYIFLSSRSQKEAA